MVDLNGRTIRLGGRTASLTDAEERLLRLLLAAEGQPVARAVLLEKGLEYRPDLKTRALDHAVTRLRKKLGDNDTIQSVYGVGYSLPFIRDSDLVGRRHELSLLADSASRSVLMHGAGGIGKTRLARTVAGSFIALVGVVTVEELRAAVATALDATPPGIEEALSWHEHTLVLDNLEQLDAESDDQLLAWAAMEGVRIVGTSRRRHPFAQVTISVPPLSPDEVQQLLRRRGGPDAPLPRSLARLVSGVPLAVELLAARTRVASLDELEERASLGLFGEGGLRSSLEGTWELLEERDRLALRATGCFEGGFGLSAWEAVWGEDDALERMLALVDFSLVRRHAERFELLDAVLHFAREKDSGPWRAAHAAFYGAFGQERVEAAKWCGFTAELALERGNLSRAAPHAVGAVLGLEALLKVEGAHALRLQVLDLAPEEEQWRRADALRRMGRLEEALACCRDDVLESVLNQGGILLAQGQLDDAEVCFQRVEALAEETGNDRRLAGARFNRANIVAFRGDLDAAIALGRQAVEMLDVTTEPLMYGTMAGGLAIFELEAGRAARARLWLHRVPPRAGRSGVLLHAEYALAWFEAEAGNLEQALERLQEIESRCGPRGEIALASDAMEARGVFLALKGNELEGLDCLERAASIHRRTGRAESLGRATFFASVVEHRLGGAAPDAKRMAGTGVEGRFARLLLSLRSDQTPP